MFTTFEEDRIHYLYSTQCGSIEETHHFVCRLFVRKMTDTVEHFHPKCTSKRSQQVEIVFSRCGGVFYTTQNDQHGNTNTRNHRSDRLWFLGTGQPPCQPNSTGCIEHHTRVNPLRWLVEPVRAPKIFSYPLGKP